MLIWSIFLWISIIHRSMMLAKEQFHTNESVYGRIAFDAFINAEMLTVNQVKWRILPVYSDPKLEHKQMENLLHCQHDSNTLSAHRINGSLKKKFRDTDIDCKMN